MFDGYDCSHSISDICSGKVRIFIFQNSKFSCILVDHGRKCRFKSGQMHSAFTVVNIITEAKNVFMELIDILECHFHFNSVRSSFKINRLMDLLFLSIQILDKSDDSFRFVVGDLLFFSIS